MLISFLPANRHHIHVKNLVTMNLPQHSNKESLVGGLQLKPKHR